MTDPNQGGAPEGAPQLSAEEQAAVLKGQEGLSDTAPAGIPPSEPQRPEWVPEQFWKEGKVDAEGLAKSYHELRAKMDSGKPADPPAAPANEQAPVGQDGKIAKPDAPVSQPIQSVIDTVRDEFTANGSVTDETLAAAEAAGIPKEIVATYLEGVRLITEKTLADIHAFAGGEQNYSAMAKWAAETLNETELEAYNTALENGALRENAVRGLYARYAQARP
ncbi:MAG: hypothetical protein ACKOXK_04000, partial [Chakrabartia sp.]